MTTRTVAIDATPSTFVFDPLRTALVIIDMQRDFIEPGGFGESLGNDVSLLGAIVPAVVELLALARLQNWFVIHTRESHLPDLSDCPPAKRMRGAPDARIGDVGTDGPHSRARRTRQRDCRCACARGWRACHRQTRQGRVPCHPAVGRASRAWHHASRSLPASRLKFAFRHRCVKPTTGAMIAC